MRELSRLLIVVGALGTSTAAYAQCTRDTDCKGDRVCDQGVCVDPDQRGGGAELAPPPPPPQDEVRRPPPRRQPAAEAAVDRPGRQNVFSFNVLGMTVGLLGGALVLPVEYESAFGTHTSWFLAGSLGIGSSAFSVGGGGGLKYYFFGTAPAGLYVGGLGAVSFLSTPLGNAAGLALGGTGGYQFVLDNGLAINLGVVLGMNVGGGGISPLISLEGTLGFAF